MALKIHQFFQFLHIFKIINQETLLLNIFTVNIVEAKPGFILSIHKMHCSCDNNFAIS